MKNAQTHERNIFGFTFKLNFCKKSLWANFIITTVAWNICFVKCLNYREDSFITYNLNFNYQIIQLAYWFEYIGNVNRSKLQIKINYFSAEYRSIMFHSICGFCSMPFDFVSVSFESTCHLSFGFCTWFRFLFNIVIIIKRKDDNRIAWCFFSICCFFYPFNR